MRQRRLKNEINVVPYIDVMLVLLVIFMVATPMMTTSAVDVPTVDKASTAPAKPLEVVIRADQSLSLIDRARGGQEESVSRADLKQRLRDLTERDPEQPVLIVGDKQVRYEAVLAVMDEAKKAQVKRVSLLTQSSGK